MKKSILIGVLLIIVTILSSCNNSERYHFSHSSNSPILFVIDSKTGKVYLTDIEMKSMETWDPIKKTCTYDKIKKLNFPKDLTDKSENQPQLKQESMPKKKTVAELGKYAKENFPGDYANMDDVSAGKKVLMEYSEYKDKVKGDITPLSPAPRKLTLQELGKKIKKSYPDKYGDLSDKEAGKRVIQKYPQLKSNIKKKNLLGVAFSFLYPVHHRKRKMLTETSKHRTMLTNTLTTERLGQQMKHP